MEIPDYTFDDVREAMKKPGNFKPGQEVNVRRSNGEMENGWIVEHTSGYVLTKDIEAGTTKVVDLDYYYRATDMVPDGAKLRVGIGDEIKYSGRRYEVTQSYPDRVKVTKRIMVDGEKEPRIITKYINQDELNEWNSGSSDEADKVNQEKDETEKPKTHEQKKDGEKIIILRSKKDESGQETYFWQEVTVVGVGLVELTNMEGRVVQYKTTGEMAEIGMTNPTVGEKVTWNETNYIVGEMVSDKYVVQWLQDGNVKRKTVAAENVDLWNSNSKEEFALGQNVLVERSDGNVEYGWSVTGVNDGRVDVIKFENIKGSSQVVTRNKSILISELKRMNQVVKMDES